MTTPGGVLIGIAVLGVLQDWMTCKGQAVATAWMKHATSAASSCWKTGTAAADEQMVAASARARSKHRIEMGLAVAQGTKGQESKRPSFKLQ